MSSLEERFWLMWVPGPVPADEGRLMCQACGRWRGEKHGPDCGIRPLLDTIGELPAALAAARRVIANDYIDWSRAGGPNECEHGYVRSVDRALAEEGRGG